MKSLVMDKAGCLEEEKGTVLFSCPVDLGIEQEIK